MSKEKLMSDKNDLKDIQIGILEKFFIAFDKIPIAILTKLPEFDADTCQQLRSLYQRVKAKIRQADKKIQSINIQDQNDNAQFIKNKEVLENSHDFINNYEADLEYYPSATGINYITSDQSKCTNHLSEANFSNEEFIIKNHNSVLNESYNNLDTYSNDLLNSKDLSLKQNLNQSNDSVNSPIQTKRKSQFQLKMPIKATINPVVSKQIQEMMNRNQQGRNSKLYFALL
jgi:bloom syndrome protein